MSPLWRGPVDRDFLVADLNHDDSHPILTTFFNDDRTVNRKRPSDIVPKAPRDCVAERVIENASNDIFHFRHLHPLSTCPRFCTVSDTDYKVINTIVNIF